MDEPAARNGTPCSTSGPVAVIGVRNTADISAAVRWAGERGIAVAVHATGHGSRSYRSAVVLRTERMNRCVVDAERRTATVDAGVRWEAVITRATAHGLAPLNGSSPTVGVIGYTLGGGVGALARQYGFAADHVRSLELVTADGRCRHVSPTSHPDLYWAVLGAPGSFGVVTRLEFDLMPVRRVYGGCLYFDAEQAPAILPAFRTWTADLPDATTASVALLTGPAVPSSIPIGRGRALVHLRFAYLGDSETGARVLAPMRAAGRAVVDTVRDMPYAAVTNIFGNPCEPASGFRAGVFLDGLDGDAVDALLTAADPARHQPPAAVELRHLGGALGRLPIRPNCVAGRDAEYLLGLRAHPSGADVVPDACAHVLAAVTPWTSDVLPVNYLHSGPARSAGPFPWSGPDHARLRQLKRAHDPDNTFRVGPTVQP